MNKKTLYLTFDCEVWSKNKNIEEDFYISTIAIANFFEKEKIPATFFISLSRKFPEIKNYYETLDKLLKKLKSYKYISVQPHLHFYDLPIKGINSKSDTMDKYSYKESSKMIKWAIKFLNKYNYKSTIFRPSGYITNKNYYKILKENNLQSSNLIEDEHHADFKISTFKSLNRKLHPINSIITTEIIPAKKVHKEFQKTQSKNLVSNFHSFSVYSSTTLSWHPCSLLKIINKIRKKINNKRKNSYEWKQMRKFVQKYKNKYEFKNF